MYNSSDLNLSYTLKLKLVYSSFYLYKVIGFISITLSQTFTLFWIFPLFSDKFFNKYSFKFPKNLITLKLTISSYIAIKSFSNRTYILYLIGVVLNFFGLIKKRDKRLDKSRAVLLNYFLKNFKKSASPTLNYLQLKHCDLQVLNLLKRVDFFKSIGVFSLSFLQSLKQPFVRRLRRIKKRIKKRIFAQELK